VGALFLAATFFFKAAAFLAGGADLALAGAPFFDAVFFAAGLEAVFFEGGMDLAGAAAFFLATLDLDGGVLLTC